MDLAAADPILRASCVPENLIPAEAGTGPLPILALTILNASPYRRGENRRKLLSAIAWFE
jgi:hypothetical protein